MATVQLREDQVMGAAWTRCEAALPSGWWAVECIGAGGRYLANAYAREEDQDRLAATLAQPGETPAAALESLAVALETRTGRHA